MYWAILLLFTAYSFVVKGVTVSVFKFLALKKTLFFIFISQKSSWFVSKSLCKTLSIRGSINMHFRILSYFNFIIFLYHPNLIISTFGKRLLIPLWPTESAEFTNLAYRTKTNLTWLLIVLQYLYQFYFVTTKMIKTLIWHLTHNPLTICCLLQMFLHMRNLLTPMKKNLQTIHKMINIQLQTLLLMMILINLKQKIIFYYLIYCFRFFSSIWSLLFGI